MLRWTKISNFRQKKIMCEPNSSMNSARFTNEADQHSTELSRRVSVGFNLEFTLLEDAHLALVKPSKPKLPYVEILFPYRRTESLSCSLLRYPRPITSICQLSEQARWHVRATYIAGLGQGLILLLILLSIRKYSGTHVNACTKIADWKMLPQPLLHTKPNLPMRQAQN